MQCSPDTLRSAAPQQKDQQRESARQLATGWRIESEEEEVMLMESDHYDPSTRHCAVAHKRFHFGSLGARRWLCIVVAAESIKPGRYSIHIGSCGDATSRPGRSVRMFFVLDSQNQITAIGLLRAHRSLSLNDIRALSAPHLALLQPNASVLRA